MAGKTALLTRFVHPDTFTREYSPTIFENQSHFIEVNNQQVRSHEILNSYQIDLPNYIKYDKNRHLRPCIFEFRDGPVSFADRPL